MFRTFCIGLLATLATGCLGAPFAYELEVEVVVPEDVARELAYPALVEVEWMGHSHGVELLCEPFEREIRVHYADDVLTGEHVSHQLLIARVVPWPDDRPCDPELVGTFDIQPLEEVPYGMVHVFEDELTTPVGTRDHTRAEAVTIEVDWQE